MKLIALKEETTKLWFKQNSIRWNGLQAVERHIGGALLKVRRIRLAFRIKRFMGAY